MIDTVLHGKACDGTMSVGLALYTLDYVLSIPRFWRWTVYLSLGIATVVLHSVMVNGGQLHINGGK